METLEGDDFDNEICYTGQILDKNTGLYYYNARFYDSESGTFTSQDTYRGQMSNPLTQNLYTYCAGDPVNRIDPTGHSWLGDKLKRLFEKLKRAAERAARKGGKNKQNTKKAVKRKQKTRAKATKNARQQVKRNTRKAKKWLKKKTKATKNKYKAIKNRAKKNVRREIDKAVEKATGVSKKKHYSRNKYNKNIPQTKEEMDDLVEAGEWVKAKPGDSACHQNHIYDGKPNQKFISKDGHREAVYWGGGPNKGNLIRNHEDMGTYNYKSYLTDSFGHGRADYFTWVCWGNAKDDKTHMSQRLVKSIVGKIKG